MRQALTRSTELLHDMPASLLEALPRQTNTKLYLPSNDGHCTTAARRSKPASLKRSTHRRTYRHLNPPARTNLEHAEAHPTIQHLDAPAITFLAYRKLTVGCPVLPIYAAPAFPCRTAPSTHVTIPVRTTPRLPFLNNDVQSATGRACHHAPNSVLP